MAFICIGVSGVMEKAALVGAAHDAEGASKPLGAQG